MTDEHPLERRETGRPWAREKSVGAAGEQWEGDQVSIVTSVIVQVKGLLDSDEPEFARDREIIKALTETCPADSNAYLTRVPDEVQRTFGRSVKNMESDIYAGGYNWTDTQKIIDWLQAMPWDEQSVIVSIIEEHDDMRVLMFTHGSFVDAAMTSIGEIEHLATRDFGGEPVTHVTGG